MAHRTYTDTEKSEALTVYEQCGPCHAAEVLGIPKGTIMGWAIEAGVRTRSIENKSAAVKASSLAWEQRRLELAHEMGAAADQALAEARAQLDEHATSKAKDAALTMAIMVDKAQLLTGAATSRTDHTSGATVDDEVAALVKELDLKAKDLAASDAG
jgi:hypothetical protein